MYFHPSRTHMFESIRRRGRATLPCYSTPNSSQGSRDSLQVARAGARVPARAAGATARAVGATARAVGATARVEARVAVVLGAVTRAAAPDALSRRCHSPSSTPSLRTGCSCPFARSAGTRPCRRARSSPAAIRCRLYPHPVLSARGK
jgi:hypothetical protein